VTTSFEPLSVAHFSDRLAVSTSELLDGPGLLSEAELADVVNRIAARRDLWEPLVIDDRERRRYELLYDDDRVDIWVLSWMPGQRTGFHDHDQSTVALLCAQGELDEGSLGVGGETKTVRMTAGMCRSGPGGYIHSVAYRTGEPAVSIHAYSPPLTCVGQYRADANGRLRRQVEHGRKELKDTTIAVNSSRVTHSDG
jgi:mannose-6-phosphate isomerase-like protein (cupin superfamily)